MKGNSFLASTLYDALNRNAAKKKMKKIAEENKNKQGIIEYQPSQIEAFFGETEPLGNIFLSGGDKHIRHRAIARAVECAYSQGYFPVILHCGNDDLERTIAGYYGSSVAIVNKVHPEYDPFIGCTNAEICRLTIQSTSKGSEIQGRGRYYLDGISDFIRAKGIPPYIRMYITCPHLMLIDKVSDAEIQGTISASASKQIISEISQGESERGNIENFFSTLDMQAGSILATKRNLSSAFNLRTVASAGGILMMDTISTTNKLLQNIVVGEIELLLASRKKVFLCIDGIQFTAEDRIREIIAKSGTDCAVLLSAEDTYASFCGDDNLFFSVVGKATKVVVSKHSSSYSCQKWSDVIGSYDKQEISESATRSFNVFGYFGAGATESINVNSKREQIVKPEEIARMDPHDVFILSKSTGELAHTTIL